MTNKDRKKEKGRFRGAQGTNAKQYALFLFMRSHISIMRSCE